MSLSESTPWRPHRIAIIGVGLLGGSVGLAIRRAWPDAVVIGQARRESTLREAIELGAITAGELDFLTAVRGADVVVVATPVDVIAAQVIEASRVCSADALITDVGSTKAKLVARIGDDPKASSCFVGAHPIAGGEKAGVVHARHDLFVGRTVVLTPDDRVPAALVDRATRFWQATGATTCVVSPDIHDAMLAATSHVPHLVAALLVTSLPENSEPFLGTGWRDSTRIAAGAPEIWTAICKDNRAAIVDQLENFQRELAQLIDHLRQGCEVSIDGFLREACDRRKSCMQKSAQSD